MINTTYVLPKPQNDQLFEDLVCDIFAHEFKNPNLQRYGRKGQQQDGIDILGDHYFVGQDYSFGKLTAIQCKNHTVPRTDKQLTDEIDAELVKLEESTLPIEQYLFVTSAENSKPVIDHVAKLRNQRAANGKCPVYIQFWDSITEKVTNNSSILYKYFTKLLPSQLAENLALPDLHGTTRQTLSIGAEDLLTYCFHEALHRQLREIALKNLSGVEPSEPYKLYIGISAHKNVHFRAKVDLDVNFASFFGDVEKLEEKFEALITAINNLLTLLVDPFFATTVVLYTDIEINFALLLGRAFVSIKDNFLLFLGNKSGQPIPV